MVMGTNMGHVWTISFVINLSYKNKECYLLHKCSKRSRYDVRINAVCAGADGFATWISSSCGLKTFAPSNSQENEVFSFSCKVQLVMIYRSNNTRKCQMFLLQSSLVAWAEPRWCLGIPKNTQLLYQKNTYTSIKHICICYSGLYSLFLKSKRHSHPMCRHPLSRPISKPLPDGPRKQELEPIPAQSLLRFPAMVAARDCGQQPVATLGRLTLPPHWCREPLYCAGAVGQLGRPQGGPRRHAQLSEAKGHRPRTTTRCLLP